MRVFKGADLGIEVVVIGTKENAGGQGGQDRHENTIEAVDDGAAEQWHGSSME
jgi:hypothetical protein